MEWSGVWREVVARSTVAVAASALIPEIEADTSKINSWRGDGGELRPTWQQPPEPHSCVV